MGELQVDESNSPPVVSPEEMAGGFHGELIGAMPDAEHWLGAVSGDMPLDKAWLSGSR